MPKPTFLNLPDNKRNRIIELALDEFSTHPYRQASLSRIVARAGIAKGSMYQYFENKLDLYRWLVTEEVDRRREQWLQTGHVNDDSVTRDSGLFVALERMVLSQVGFMLAHPRLAQLATNAMEPTGDEDLRELHGALRREQVQGLTDLIQAAQTSGEIRSGVDARSLAHFIDALLVRGTTNAVLERLGVEVHEFVSSGEHKPSLADHEWRSLVQQALELIGEGIRGVTSQARAKGRDGAGDGAGDGDEDGEGEDGEGDSRPARPRASIDWRCDESSDRLELPS